MFSDLPITNLACSNVVKSDSSIIYSPLDSWLMPKKERWSFFSSWWCSQQQRWLSVFHSASWPVLLMSRPLWEEDAAAGSRATATMTLKELHISGEWEKILGNKIEVHKSSKLCCSYLAAVGIIHPKHLHSFTSMFNHAGNFWMDFLILLVISYVSYDITWMDHSLRGCFKLLI